jgi:hypothetical protein
VRRHWMKWSRKLFSNKHFPLWLMRFCLPNCIWKSPNEYLKQNWLFLYKHLDLTFICLSNPKSHYHDNWSTLSANLKKIKKRLLLVMKV